MTPVSITRVEATDAGLRVHLSSNSSPVLDWRWVRDHGEDEASFDPNTHQRRVYAIGPEEPKAALNADCGTHDDRPVVSITWPEAPESTWISERTLLKLLAPGQPNAQHLWHEPQDATATRLEATQVMADDIALGIWLRDLHHYGYATLKGFTGGHKEVAVLAARIGYARTTIFGTTWDLSSDIQDHDDTAYSQSFLAPHTDGTYSHDAPGLQMFCCVERTGTGGESIVVDAFAIAETLRTDFPDDFEVLTSVSVPGHYVEPGIELRASRPAILLDPDGDVRQVSMNNYDRSPMLLPPDDMRDFYRAYGRLHQLANDPGRWKSIRLEAGDVLINDNWRVLHGRQAYTGARHFIGCYLNHEDFESRLRTLAI